MIFYSPELDEIVLFGGHTCDGITTTWHWGRETPQPFKAVDDPTCWQGVHDWVFVGYL